LRPRPPRPRLPYATLFRAGLRRCRRNARALEAPAAIVAHRLTGPQAPRDVQRLLEARRPLAGADAHAGELLVVRAHGALHDEAGSEEHTSELQTRENVVGR